MSKQHANWHDVLRQVPEGSSAASVSDPSPIDIQIASAMPPWSSPAQLIASLTAMASGRSERKIMNILQSDHDRRMSIARKDMNRLKKVVAVTTIIFANAAVGVLLLPLDSGSYFIDLGMPTMVASIVGILALIASIVIEKRSAPRSLPYSSLLLIGWAALFAADAVAMGIDVSEWGLWGFLGTTMSVVLAGLTAIGYVALFCWVTRRPTMVQALHRDTPEGRAFDEKLHEHVMKIVHKRDDLDIDLLRSHTVGGIKDLYETGRITEDVAVSMVRLSKGF